MITKNVKECCKMNGISIRELEKCCGMGINTFYKWDYNSPSVDKVIKVAKFLNVSLDELCGEELNLNQDVWYLKNQLMELDQKQLDLVKIYVDMIKRGN